MNEGGRSQINNACDTLWRQVPTTYACYQHTSKAIMELEKICGEQQQSSSPLMQQIQAGQR